MARERDLLARITAAVPMDRADAGRLGLRLGIGDDAALIVPKRDRDVVLSSDYFIEGSHFLLKEHPPESVGYKSLARAASDLAAMGAEPGFFLLNLAMPERRTGAWLDGYLRGLARASRRLDISLIGGDLAKAARVSVCVIVIGYAEYGAAIPRTGAKSGDLVCVSGRLGGARLGLEIVRKKLQREAGAKRLLLPHLYPEVRLKLGAWLARNRIASAMMDISDGLSIDLERLCEASRVGATIEAARLPCARIPEEWAKRLRLGPSAELEFALHGGDDYELLFTVPPSRARKLRLVPRSVPVTRIGTIGRDRRIQITGHDGRTRALPPHGWDHFARPT